MKRIKNLNVCDVRTQGIVRDDGSMLIDISFCAFRAVYQKMSDQVATTTTYWRSRRGATQEPDGGGDRVRPGEPGGPHPVH